MHQHLLATLKGEELERYRRNPIPPALDKKLTAEARQLLRDDRALDRFAVPENRVFWGEDEEDEDLRTDEVDEDKFQGDEMLSMAHMKLDEIRDYRHWSRVAAWEMPLLASM